MQVILIVSNTLFTYDVIVIDPSLYLHSKVRRAVYTGPFKDARSLATVPVQ